ncbi:MAG: cyclase family protein [Desulfosarcina sp.]|nr:cyclase family protein [Desulfosarcina sp.]MBC2765884.1 cyclase family protein [Desulfosarcina sp.]
MDIIDLSHFLEAGMPVYPGTGTPVLAEVNTIDSDGFREKKLTFYSHTGTHMDAPAHIVAGTKTLDQLPVDTFCGDAFLLNCTRAGKGTVDLQDLLPHEDAIRKCAFLLLLTGWSRYWGDERYFSDYPVLTPDAARWLAALGVKGIGMDTISADQADSVDLPIHNILLGAGMVIVENLTNLDAILKESFVFSCFPLKIKDADGSPVRAVAMVP